MNTEFFIAKKLTGFKDSSNRISKPIVNISLISIILGLAVMIITVSIVTGFQNKIREKVIGFGSHIQISNMEDNTSMESSPLLIDSTLISSILENQLVKHIQSFAYKPAILQSEEKKRVISTLAHTDTVVNRDVLGVLFKGIDLNYDLSFFADKLIDGELLNYNDVANEVLISKKIAQLLQYKVGDTIDAFFILNNTPKKRNFIIRGIYETGLEEFDKKIIFTKISALQAISNWGVSSAITVLDTCINNKFVLKGLTFGNFGNYYYKWNQKLSKSPYFLIDGLTDSQVTFETAEHHKNDPKPSPWDKSSVQFIIDSACGCTETLLGQKPLEFKSDKEIIAPFGKILIDNGPGTSQQYVGGYEILIEKWENLDMLDSIIYEEIPFELKTTKITDKYIEIFSWLNFLDMNIAVIIVMMLIVSLINMTTSLLVLIIEKTNFIGVLKAVGTTNWSIRKIFIFNALILLGRGMIWGNIIAIAFIFIQQNFEVLPLNPAIYYLDAVPVSFSLSSILLINLLTILTCLLVLIIPSYLITKIKPIKAIKFN
ncbi:MAG: FtsX-like permease family protein [Putridiphycobacter sp.]|nr:FtsX-like permease family protein [Putridiphycobacter sp.]